MKSEYRILDKIKTENANPYSVPFEYFEGLPNSILNRVTSKSFTYSTPPDYFENLSTQVLKKINTVNEHNNIFVELEAISPLLNSLNKTNVYTLPTDYFETNTINLVDRKITPVKKINTSFRFTKIIAAAVVMGFIAIGTLMIFNKTSKNKQFIASYKQAIKTDIEQSVLQISDAELSNVLDLEKNITANLSDETTILPWQNINNLQEEIKVVTDEEIKAYFKENNIENVDNISPNS